MKLDEVARRIECRVEGPAEVEITGVAGLAEACERDLSFLSNPKYYRKAQSTRAAAVIVGPDTELAGRALLRSDNPYLAFARALELFHPPPAVPPVVHPTAAIAPSARIGKNASVGAYVVVEDGVTLGDNCVLKSFVAIYHGAKIGDRFFAHSHAVVRENVEIGNDVILQNGVVVGGDGFGFARQPDGSYRKLVQPGTVVIEDDVEIQAHSCIDRPSVGVTRIRRGAKLDNLVQVGHGCDVGENTLVCGQAGLAGSTRVGRNVVLAGQVGAAGHLTIGDNAIVTSQSGIPSDVAAGSIVSGSPAIENVRWLKCAAAFARLPELFASVRKIRKYLNGQGADV
ncbi:MAG: UDP-3-O-(3-hydroxymyristoyl)glucosamine N-acyltransferase [Terriglobia bacterium]